VVILAIRSLGAVPVYVDIDPVTLNPDPACIAAALTEKVKAILFLHTYGNPGGLDRVAEIAKARNVTLIEDCAQSVPLRRSGSSPGSRGSAAIFSNNLGKPLPAGSGGIAASKESALADSVRRFRDTLPVPGRVRNAVAWTEEAVYRNILTPSTYWFMYDAKRLTSSTYRDRRLGAEIETEILKSAYQPSRRQLRKGQAWLSKAGVIADHRQACCRMYEEALRAAGVQVPLKADVPFLFFPVLIDRKDELLKSARCRRVEIVPFPVHTPIAPVVHPGNLGAYGYRYGACPIADEVSRRLVGLPTHLGIDDRTRESIVSLVIEHCRKWRAVGKVRAAGPGSFDAPAENG
jgi:dTDP-4-amino-4,6-dideoxygalactose transaminase